MKSLDLEEFAKKKKMTNYRTGFYQDLENRENMRSIDNYKQQRNKEEYTQL